MENEVKNAGGASAPDAGQQPVKKVEDSKVAEVLEATSKRIDELEEQNKKLSEERENYRIMGLKAKDKIKALRDQGYDVGEEEKPQFNEDSIIDKVVERLKPIIQPKEEVDSLKTKISELATALKNRSQINNAGSGGGEETEAPKKEFFTPEQIADLKARGLDPKKVEENMKRNKDGKF
jgi:hypothetical protein